MISEDLKHHIWIVWVGTQLIVSIEGVSDALEMKFEDLSMKYDPIYQIFMALGGQKS